MAPPNQWTVRKLADIGTSAAFVRETLKLCDVVKETLIEGQQREEVSNAISNPLSRGAVTLEDQSPYQFSLSPN